jgi:GGDEF domain-containing protein
VFTHDGLKDVLTHLAAPPLFYEELRREIARMERNGERFAILRLVLDLNFQKEVDVVNFSEAIVRATRGEELVARLGEFECAVLVRGNENAAENLLQRIALNCTLQESALRFTTSHISSRAGESALDLLNRLDTLVLT